MELLNLKHGKIWSASATLQENGVAPFAIGTKYMDCRRLVWLHQHAYQWRISTFNWWKARVPYSDERVKKTFANWAELVEPGYYLEECSYSWQEAHSSYGDKAAMYLIGELHYAASVELDGKMDFFQFPVIWLFSVPMSWRCAYGYGCIFLQKAKNKEDARKF